MLAHDEGMDVSAVYLQLPAQELFEAGGVQYRAGADDPFPGVAGELIGGVGQHVHWVRDHQQGPLEIPRGDLGHDAPQDGRIPADQLQAGLAGLLVHPGGNHHQSAVGDVVIAAGGDLHGGAVGEAVAEIKGLPLRFGGVGVDEHQVGEGALL